MEGPVLGNQLKLLMIAAGSLALAVFLGFAIGSADYAPLLFGAVATVACFVWFASGRFFWVLTVASSFLGGTFPVLGGSFTPFQAMLMMGVAKFVFEDVIIRRTAKLQTARIDLLLIAAFMAVLTAHGIHDRFGMRYLGSTVWGGRNYVNVYVGLIAFFALQSMPLPAKTWNKLPFTILAVTAFDLLIAVFTTVFPSSIFKIYPFYSAVSQTSIDEIVMGVTSSTDRIGAFGNFGFVLILIVLSTVTIQYLFHPSNFFKMASFGIGGLCSLFSGFRSSVIQVLLALFVAGIRDLKRGVLVVVLVFATLLFSLSLINSQIVALPRQIQRGLAFVPGHWDYEAARDAASSNDFRFRTWGVWWNDYFPQQPLFGRGFGFKSDWTKISVYDPRKVDYQAMVEVGNIHNGFFSALDGVGIVGAVFFVAWCIRLLVLALRTPFQRDNPGGFVLRFLALYLAVELAAYWMGALTLGTFLPQLFALAGLFLRLRQESPKRPQREVREVSPATQRRFPREFARA